MSSLALDAPLDKTCPVKYEDVHEFDSGYYYHVPNEEVLTWRELLRNIPIHRAAGICSAGEIGLFGLLTHVRRELVLVDHSYKSLSVAMVKYLVLRKYGWRKAQALFTKGNKDELRQALEPLVKTLPEKVKNGTVLNELCVYYSSQIKKEWAKIPAHVGRKSCTKLDWVQFLHGDLTDLIERGPFDLLYLSNALQHTDRNRKSPLVEQVEKIVKPGGYIILADDTYAPAKHDWELVNTIKGKVNGNDWSKICWNYRLFRRPVAVAA